MTRRLDLPTYPNGWYAVAFASELAPGGVIARKHFGEELVIWRSDSGGVRVQGAYCPHMGAHLGHGSCVEDDSIRCPFHGWRFDGAGACVEIAYSDRIPAAARVRSWPVREQDGVILAWCDSRERAPSWEMPHFDTSGEIKIDGPCFRVTVEPEPGDPQRGVPLDSMVHGPGLVLAESHQPAFSGRYRLYITPIDEERSELRGMVSVKAARDADAIHEVMNRAVFAEWEADVPIWEHKTYRPGALFTSAEQGIAQFRRFYQRFYDDSPAATA